MAKRRVRHHVNPLADMTEHSFAGFDNDRPIIMDIGADRGEFTQKLIEKFGDTKNFIVCEIRKPLAERLRKKFSDHENVAVFDGDIVRNFLKIIKPSVDRGVIVEEVYVNFPDPWFKDRHKKRRVITEKFVLKVQEWMPAGTKWIFQTDQKQLFEETVEMLRGIEGVTIEFFNNTPHDVTTKWEEAKIAQNSVIYRMMFYIK
ncbi:MAG: rRNA adenine N-6-methyltransferase family protein [Parcubacteria group bacterium]|jgi:tRNA (guanine-N7-)-methyltransferase